MTFQDQAMQTSYQMGAYKAIAEMMADAVGNLDSTDDFDREWATKRLVMLAEQFKETEAKFEKGLDLA